MRVSRQFSLALAYFITGWLGLQIPYIGTQITLIWLPTGIAVAALLRWGPQVWPGILIGAFLVNVVTGSPWWVAAGIAVGNTLGPYLASHWLRQIGFHTQLDRQKDVGALAIAGCVGMTVPAVCGVAVLYLAGLLPAQDVAAAWLSWWMGDAVGVLLATPLLLTLNRTKGQQLNANMRELLLWLLIAGLVAWLAFFKSHPAQDGALPLAFLTLPLFVWAAMRFGSTGAALSGLLFSLLATWGTALGHGTFAVQDVQISLFLLWSYITIMVLTGLLITALQAERQRVQDSLRESEEKLRGLYELSPLGIALTDMHGRYVEFNAAFSRITGYTAEELPSLDYWALTPRKYAPEEERQLASLQRNGHYGPYEKEYIRKDGQLIPLRLNGMLITRADGERYIWSLVEDITDWRQVETALHREVEKTQALLRHASDGIHILDLNGNIIEISDAFCTMLGYSRAEMIGMNVTQWDAQFPVEHLTTVIDAHYHGKERTQFDTKHRRKDGSIFDVEISGMPLVLDGKPFMFYSSRDITDRKTAEESIKNLAFFDPLTHLPNRRLLRDRLNQAMTLSARSGRCGALLFIDLDNFKSLNDTLGHDQGDMLLEQVAQTLVGSVREGDTVARFGGDEFVILLEELGKNQDEAATQTRHVAENIREALSNAVLPGAQLHYTCSIGATLFYGHRDSVEELLKQADLAMYQAKAAGRNVVRFFDQGMQAVVNARVALEASLRQALRRDEFTLFYQPQIDSAGRISGAEALVRWRHPERGVVSPYEFIPLAEETGLILPLGLWVLEAACAQLKAWSAHPATAGLSIAVNISARQFRHPDFTDQVMAVLEQTGIRPSQLKLEITESLLLENVEDVIAKMTVLKAIGVNFSLDDFGTGYSSLAYLKQLPFDQLKIDRSFVRDVLTDPNDAAIVRTIIALAKTLGIEVIAEGVESRAQQEFLAAEGCRAYQGYLFGRPAPAEEFGAILVAKGDSKNPDVTLVEIGPTASGTGMPEADRT